MDFPYNPIVFLYLLLSKEKLAVRCGVICFQDEVLYALVDKVVEYTKEKHEIKGDKYISTHDRSNGVVSHHEQDYIAKIKGRVTYWILSNQIKRRYLKKISLEPNKNTKNLCHLNIHHLVQS